MAKQQAIQQLHTTIQNFLALDISPLKDDPPAVTAWNNLDINDLFDAFDDLVKPVERLSDEELIIELPWNIIHGLTTQLNNAHTHTQNFINSKTQQTFQNAFPQIEGARTNIQTWGINYLYSLTFELDAKSSRLDEEIQKSLLHNREIESLKQNVSQLIEPAVAGSLSKSFSERKRDLNTNQDRWFWASVAMAVVSLGITFFVVDSIVGVFDNKEIISIVKNSIDSGNGVIWSSVLLRLGLLLPVYTLFGFAFSQYKKERSLEEEYAHKAAVATSLPNYGDLAIEDNVKDQILSEASKVIFASPVSNKIEKDKTKVPGLDQVNRLMTNMQKFIPKTKE